MATGIDIAIQTDTGPYEQFMKRFPLQAEKALNKALNRIGKSAETATNREITSVYNISTKRLKAAYFVIPARGGRLVWTIQIKRRKNQPNITSFGAKATKKAITVSIIKGKRQKFPGAFITTFKKTGGKAAFQRDEIKTVPSKGKFKGKISSRGPRKGQRIERAALFSLYGPQIVKMFGNKNAQLAFQNTVIKRSAIEIPREFQFLADKLARQVARK